MRTGRISDRVRAYGARAHTRTTVRYGSVAIRGDTRAAVVRCARGHTRYVTRSARYASLRDTFIRLSRGDGFMDTLHTFTLRTIRDSFTRLYVQVTVTRGHTRATDRYLALR